ncbi:MAG: ankyrin repeat domain-containing protein, partial [bacterium]
TDTVHALAGTHNANVEAVNRYGRTALMIAAVNGHTDTVNALVGTYNANVDAVDREQNGWTALMYASCNGQTDTVNALIRHGASVARRG